LSKKTLKVIKKTGNDAVLQVKNNQPKLLRDCEKISLNNPPDDIHYTGTKERSRREYREVSIYRKPDFTDKVWNKYITAVIAVKRIFKKINPKSKQLVVSQETAFYVSTKNFSAKVLGQIIRGHWSIENENHYVKDTAMREDKSRIRKNPQNMARLRSFGLNVMRVNGSENISRDLYRNSLNLDRTLSYSTI
jgi:predicted transposase YbfD/YdcC